MRIKVIGHNGKDFFSEEGAWGKFFDTLQANGNVIVNANSTEVAEAIIAHKHVNSLIEYAEHNNIPINRRVLVIWEPSIVDNSYYNKKNLEKYGYILAPSKLWLEEAEIEGFSFNWPQSDLEPIEDIQSWKNRLDKFVIIQGNKFSARKGELYSLRRSIIASKLIPIDLYGSNWNEKSIINFARWFNSVRRSSLSSISLQSLQGIGKKFSNYRGATKSKLNTFSKYKFSIVIENMSNYVSEKLFDSVSGGCITIYVGPNLKNLGIKFPDLTICSRDRSDIEKACANIAKLGFAEQYELVIDQRKALREHFLQNNSNNVLNALASEIINFFESRSD